MWRKKYNPVQIRFHERHLMRIGPAVPSYLSSLSNTNSSRVLGRMFAVLLLFAGIFTVGGLAPATAEAKKATELLPVSSDGSEIDAKTLELLSEFAESSTSTMDPATAPVAGAGSTGAFFETETGPVAPGGEFGTQTVIGNDDRSRTTPTDWWPASATVQMTMLNNSGQRIFFCTGFMIGPDTMATAGHCVHNNDFGGWITGRDFIAYPGRDGATSPYGGCRAVSFHSNTFWTVNRNREYDFGAVKLDCEIGNATGTYGYRWQSASLDGTGVVTRGYPGDKPNGEQWVAYDQIRYSHVRVLWHLADNVPGNSGNPLYTYRDDCGGPCALAVDTHGCPNQSCNNTNPPYTSHNSGTRITQEVFNFFQAWENL